MKKPNKTNYFKLSSISFIILSYFSYFALLYKLIGETGGLVYIATYSPILIFIVLFLVGLPIAVSKTISKYDMLGYHKLKNKVFNKVIITYTIVSIVLFILILMFSSSISHLIVKNNNISLPLKLLSCSLVFIPALGIYRGYFEGIDCKIHSYISKFIELFIKFSVVVILYILSLNIKISLEKTLIILFVSNAISYILALVYLIILKRKLKKYKSKKEPVFAIKSILKNIIKSSFINSITYVFIIVCLMFDVISLTSILPTKLNYGATVSNSITSTITLWGFFLNIPFIILVLKMLGNFSITLSKYSIQKDKDKIRSYISKLYKKVMFFSLPLSILACYCSTHIWNVVYSSSKYGLLAYHYLGTLILGLTMFIICNRILLILKEYKMISVTTIIGILIKVLFSSSMIYGINKLGFPAFYGSITATLLSLLVASIITIVYVNSKYHIDFESIIRELFNIIIAVIIMILVLIGINHILNIESSTKSISTVLLLINFIIGLGTYGFTTYSFKTIKNIFN